MTRSLLPYEPYTSPCRIGVVTAVGEKCQVSAVCHGLNLSRLRLQVGTYHDLGE